MFKPPKKAILDPLIKEVSRNIESTIKKFLPEISHNVPFDPSSIINPIKGAYGEMAVNVQTMLELPPDIYHLYHNVILPHGTKTTQIDHLIVSVYSVFILETKNWAGYIIARPGDHNWIQLQSNGQRRSFHNPVEQNDYHRQAVAQLLKPLNIPATILCPIVVLTGNTKFAGSLPPSTLFLKDLIAHITCFQNPVISLDEKQRLREAIDSARVKRP